MTNTDINRRNLIKADQNRLRQTKRDKKAMDRQRQTKKTKID